jgi:hypothetical protein
MFDDVINAIQIVGWHNLLVLLFLFRLLPLRVCSFFLDCLDVIIKPGQDFDETIHKTQQQSGRKSINMLMLIRENAVRNTVR